MQENQPGGNLTIAELADAHYAIVYRFCARRVGTELAKDAAQETFLTAQRRLKDFRGESSVQVWLLGIANNHCRNLSRKTRKESPLMEAWDCNDERAEGASQIVDREALRQALGKLSPEHREVVLLHEVEGLTYEDAAKVLDVPVGTVKSRLHHAFLNLRRLLSGPEGASA